MTTKEVLEDILTDLKCRRETVVSYRDSFITEQKFASAGSQDMILTGLVIAENIVLTYYKQHGEA